MALTDPNLQLVQNALDTLNGNNVNLTNQVASDNVTMAAQAKTITDLNAEIAKLKAGTPPPPPPPTGTSYLNLEKQVWANKTGAASGGGNANHGTSTQSINADGSRRFTINPSIGPKKDGYDNYIWGINNLIVPLKLGQISKVIDTIKFKVSDITKIQGIEWETQRNAPMQVANMAFCVDPRDPKWAYFYFTGIAGQGLGWVKVAAIPYNAAMFKDWVTVVMECAIDDVAKTVTHKTVTINGTTYDVIDPSTGKQFVQTQALKDNSLRFDVNFQMDSTSIPKGATVPPSVYVDMYRSLYVE